MVQYLIYMTLCAKLHKRTLHLYICMCYLTIFVLLKSSLLYMLSTTRPTMITLEKRLIMYRHQQTQKAQVTYSTPVLKNKKSALSQQLFSRRIGCVSLGLIVCIVSVLTLVNLHSPSHLLNTSSGPRLSPTKGQIAHEFSALWLSPTKGQVVHDIVRLEASIHLALSDNFKVDHIIFTGWWTGVDLNNWRNICSVSSPKRDTTFQCDGNLRLLQAPAGTITISFDLYDTQGHVKLAPGGGFAITYSPLSISR